MITILCKIWDTKTNQSKTISLKFDQSETREEIFSNCRTERHYDSEFWKYHLEFRLEKKQKLNINLIESKPECCYDMVIYPIILVDFFAS